MSFRDAPPPGAAFATILQDILARIRRLERASTLRGTPSVARLRVGDVLIEVDASTAPTLLLTARNVNTGTDPVVIATLP